jgi:hypothetical protein
MGETFASLASSALLINLNSLISFNLFLPIELASRMLSTENKIDFASQSHTQRTLNLTYIIIAFY